MASDLVGARTVAEILGVSRATVVRMARDGRLPGVLVGKSYAFNRADVVRYQLARYGPQEPLTAPVSSPVPASSGPHEESA